MLFLVLAVTCSLAIGMLFKHTGRIGLDTMALLTVNYAVALGVALALLRWGPQNDLAPWSWDLGLLTLGTLTGALFIFGFLIYAIAIEVAGMSLAIGVMRISVVVPFLGSWWIWGEVPTLWQGLGLLMAGTAFFLISARPAHAAATPIDQAPTASPQKVALVLGTLFIAGGLVDLSLKTYDEVFAATSSRSLFLLLIFGVACLIGCVDVAIKGLRHQRWPDRPTLAWGLLLGVINYGSVEFLLLAVRDLPGTFVFPANSIALVLGGALLGVLIWHETLTRLNRWGLFLAALALAFLSSG